MIATRILGTRWTLGDDGVWRRDSDLRGASSTLAQAAVIEAVIQRQDRRKRLWAEWNATGPRITLTAIQAALA